MKTLLQLKLILLQLNFLYIYADIATTPYYIQSIKSNKISSYTDTMLQGRIFAQGISVSSTFSTSLILGDQNKDISTDIVKYNGDIATDVMLFGQVYKNGQYMSDRQYYVNYTYASNKYYSNPQKNTYNSRDQSDYTVGCNYISNEATVTVSSSQTGSSIKMNVTSVASYSFATFALISNTPGVSLLKYTNMTLNVEPLDNYLNSMFTNFGFNLSTYNDLWVIDQVYNDYAMLVLQEKLYGSLFFYNITILNETLTLSYYTRINYNAFNSTEITKIGIYNNNYLLGTRDQGFLVMNDLIPTVNGVDIITPWYIVSNATAYLVVNDFVVNEKTIYLLNDKVGLLILDLQNNYYVFSIVFYHPTLKQIDFLNNPFLGSKYIGIGIQNGENINEFFIEFLIDDEYNPLLNKVFTSFDLVVYDSFKTVDKFFTYIFNKISQTLIVIRRGMINSVPSELYNINIGKEINEQGFSIGINPISSMYDYDTQLYLPVILSNSFFLFLYAVTLPYDTLTCNFNQAGLYNVSMTLRGEVCKQSMDTDYLYTSCDKMINFTYYVYGNSSNDTVGIIAGVVCVCGAMLMGLIGFIIVKTKCCTDFNAFYLNADQEIQREDFYKEENPDTNNFRDNLIDNPQSEYQLGTMVDGKVYGNIVEGKDGSRESNKADVISKENEIEEMKRIQYNNLNKNENNKLVEGNNEINNNSVKDNYNMFDGQRNVSRTYFKKKFTKSGTEKINLEAENIVIINNANKITDRNDSNKSEEFKQVELVNVNDHVEYENIDIIKIPVKKEEVVEIDLKKTTQYENIKILDIDYDRNLNSNVKNKEINNKYDDEFS